MPFFDTFTAVHHKLKWFVSFASQKICQYQPMVTKEVQYILSKPAPESKSGGYQHIKGTSNEACGQSFIIITIGADPHWELRDVEKNKSPKTLVN